MLDLPEATIVKPLLALRDLAHRNGYPDPTDAELIGQCVEHRNGVAWHRQEQVHNVLDYNAGRLYMTAGLDGIGVYDQLATRNAGSDVMPNLAAFGLHDDEVREMEARHERLGDLLDQAFAAGAYQYDEQFEGYRRGVGLPPTDDLMEIIERDVERIERKSISTQQTEQTPPAWWWRPVPRGKGYRLKRGTVDVESYWHGPWPTRKQARRHARSSTRTAADQRVGLFAA